MKKDRIKIRDSSLEVDGQDSLTSLLRVPEAIRTQFLPHPDVSLSTLLIFKLLRTVSSDQLGNHWTKVNVASFFSKDTPDLSNVEISEALLRLPIPPIGTVNDIHNHLAEALRLGFRSLIYAHVQGEEPLHFPIWTAELWKETHRVSHRHVKPWQRAKQYTKVFETSARAEESKQLAKSANALFESLKWSAYTDSSSFNIPINLLAPLLSNDWLASEVIDQMLEELDRTLGTDGTTRACTTILTDQINICFEEKSSSPLSADHWLIKKSEEYNITGSVVGCLMHIDGNHWVPTIVDFGNWRCFTSDSRTGSIRKDVVQKLNWFARLAKRKLNDMHSCLLPISRQVDGHSCGLWALDALRRHFDIQETLTESTEYRFLRMRTFISLASPSPTTSDSDD